MGHYSKNIDNQMKVKLYLLQIYFSVLKKQLNIS